MRGGGEGEREGRKKGGKRRDKTYDPHENVPLRGSLRILVVFDVFCFIFLTLPYLSSVVCSLYLE